MTRAVLACMEAEAFGEPSPGEAIAGASAGVDVAARLRGMWS
jgi:hypothetical protein